MSWSLGSSPTIAGKLGNLRLASSEVQLGVGTSGVLDVGIQSEWLSHLRLRQLSWVETGTFVA